MHKESFAFLEGVEAGRLDTDPSLCPYADTTRKRRDWLRGHTSTASIKKLADKHAGALQRLANK